MPRLIPTFQQMTPRATFMAPGSLPYGYGRPRPYPGAPGGTSDELAIQPTPQEKWDTAGTGYRRTHSSPNFLASTHAANVTKQVEGASRAAGMPGIPKMPGQARSEALQNNQQHARAVGLQAGADFRQDQFARNNTPVSNDPLSEAKAGVLESQAAANLARGGMYSSQGREAEDRGYAARSTADTINPARANLYGKQAEESQARTSMAIPGQARLANSQAEANEARTRLVIPGQARQANAAAGLNEAKTEDPRRFMPPMRPGMPQQPNLNGAANYYNSLRKAEKEDDAEAFRQHFEKSIGIGMPATTQPSGPTTQPSTPQTPQHGVAPVQVSTPDEARRLPKGTRFIGPDGVTRMVP